MTNIAFNGLRKKTGHDRDSEMNLRELIRDIKDFPKQGIVFLDITPLIGHGEAFRHAIDALVVKFKDSGATKIVAAEARGFIFGSPLAYALGIGFVPIRKPGKLPWRTTSVTYDLEYGTDTLCMHEDAIEHGERVLIIDDVLATGGTAKGVVELVESAGGVVSGIGFLIELAFLNGRSRLEPFLHDCIIKVD